MSKRERVEDLGRIQEMSNELINHEVFHLYNGRPKDIMEWWSIQDSESKAEFLYSVVYGLGAVTEKLCEIWEIATGESED